MFNYLMTKVSFLKLIDEAILPVFLIFTSKIAGLLLANIFFSLNWQLSFTHFLLSTPFIRYSDLASSKLASDMGTVLMFICIAVGFGWAVFRSHELHLEHLHPNIVKRLFSHGKEALLVDSFEIYHQEAVWLALTWFVFIQSWLEVLAGNISLSVFSLGASIVLGLNLALFISLRRESAK